MIGLTYIRNLHNMSMQDVADKLEISKQTVSKWENGQRPIPKKRIEQLSDMFGLYCGYFNRELHVDDEIFILENKINILKNKINALKMEELNWLACR